MTNIYTFLKYGHTNAIKWSSSIRMVGQINAITHFISDTKKISYFLRSWFKKDEGKRSIYQSEEWLTYFPALNTAEKVADFLSISKADL